MQPSWNGAERHLRQDLRLATVIDACGPCTLSLERNRFRALAESILYQQLAGSAASTIAARVRAMYGGRFPTAAQLASTPLPRLRSAGVSGPKARYMRGLARACERGDLDLRALARAPDEDVVETLTAFDGIGRWTAEMFLIFSLGRPDVWPVGDYGVRKGVQRLLGQRSLPAVSRMQRVAEPWRPYRSAAAWYMWRSLDIQTPGVGGGRA